MTTVTLELTPEEAAELARVIVRAVTAYPELEDDSPLLLIRRKLSKARLAASGFGRIAAEMAKEVD